VSSSVSVCLFLFVRSSSSFEGAHSNINMTSLKLLALFVCVVGFEKSCGRGVSTLGCTSTVQYTVVS
jgi:hypothetical protein